MRASQALLANKYHTSKLPYELINIDWSCFDVVGLDLFEDEADEGRMIYFHIKSKKNKGGVLLGNSFGFGYKAMTLDEIKQSAISEAVRRGMSLDKARRQVTKAIKMGGQTL